jgi:hypothetical protein
MMPRAMIDSFQKILGNQFDASLAMLKQCLQACRPEYWEGKIANDSFRQVAYHTLFWTDYYLSPGEEAFELREVHQHGGDDRSSGGPSLGLPKNEALAYLAFCRSKAVETIAAETVESLAGPSGFARKSFTRAELHLYNLRHVQHHTGQLSAYLRRTDESLGDPSALPWIGSGWR